MIIFKIESPHMIQSWMSQYSIPSGYAIVPDGFDTTEFYTYNGFVTAEIVDGVVISMTPDVEAWEAWKAENPPVEPEPELDTWDELASAISEGVNSI